MQILNYNDLTRKNIVCNVILTASIVLTVNFYIVNMYIILKLSMYLEGNQRCDKKNIIIPVEYTVSVFFIICLIDFINEEYLRQYLSNSFH